MMTQPTEEEWWIDQWNEFSYKNDERWCGCYEGDIEGYLHDKNEKAIELIKKIILETKRRTWEEIWDMLYEAREMGYSNEDIRDKINAKL